MKHRNNIRSVL